MNPESPRLPAELATIRQQLVQYVLAAYGRVAGRSYDNFALWLNVRAHVTTNLERIYREHGLEAPPWNWLALFRRAGAWAPTNDPNAHVALVEALCTDFHDQFWKHVDYRLNHEGNLHLEFTGPTGSGKSSCAVAVANQIQAIRDDRLLDHLSFDITDLPKKLKDKGPRETVIHDEFVQTSGEGARTAQSFFQNLEDTLRASQVNLFVCSPRRQQHATMQAQLEAICWDPTKHYTVFLVWIECQPHGVLALPWMDPKHYAFYRPWKKANVERTLRGQFKDNEHTAKTVMALFEDERFTEYLWLGVNKPKMGDFNTAIMLFYPGMLTQAQVDRMAKFAYEQCYSFQRLESKFEWFFGVAPNKGFQKIATKCYEE